MSESRFGLYLENDNTQHTIACEFYQKLIRGCSTPYGFLVLCTSEFYRVLKRNSSELIAMKQKLNYTVEVSGKLTTLFILFIFFHSQNQRAFDGF